VDWNAVGALGEVLGALAVFVTLFYLALQIRHSNHARQAESRQALIDNFARLNWGTRGDEEALRLVAMGFVRWSDLSNMEKTKFEIFLQPYLANLHQGIGLYQDGVLDRETLDSIGNFMAMFIAMPGGQEWFKQTPMAVPEVKRYIEERFARPESLPPNAGEALPHWMALADEVATD
jgi:hypothetical protein